MKDIIISKEGQYWTLYLGEEQITCGYLVDVVEELTEMVERLSEDEIIEICKKGV